MDIVGCCELTAEGRLPRGLLGTRPRSTEELAWRVVLLPILRNREPCPHPNPDEGREKAYRPLSLVPNPAPSCQWGPGGPPREIDFFLMKKRISRAPPTRTNKTKQKVFLSACPITFDYLGFVVRCWRRQHVYAKLTCVFSCLLTVSGYRAGSL